MEQTPTTVHVLKGTNHLAAIAMRYNHRVQVLYCKVFVGLYNKVLSTTGHQSTTGVSIVILVVLVLVLIMTAAIGSLTLYR